MQNQNKTPLFPASKGKIRPPKFLPPTKNNNSNGGKNNNNKHKNVNNNLEELEKSVRRFEMEYKSFYKRALGEFSFVERIAIQNVGLHPENGKIRDSFVSFGYGKNMHENIYNNVKKIYAETGVNLGPKIKKRLKGFFDNDF
jgi:hypothetical protein